MKHFSLRFLLLLSLLVVIPYSQIFAQEKEQDLLKSIFEEKDSILRSKIGTPFVDFNLIDLEMNEFTEKQLVGKVTLINFWFESCAPCVAEFADLNDLYENIKDNPYFQFLSITTDSPEMAKVSKKKYKLPYPIYTASRKECDRLIPYLGFPTTIITDKQGKIRFMKGGGYLEREKVAAQIEMYKQEVLKILNE